MNPPRPLWQRALTWPARRTVRLWRSLRAGRWYGWSRPRWWPLARPWPFGPGHPHDGRQVSIFVAGREHVFVPVTYGRFRGHRFDGWLRPTPAEMSTYLAAQGLDPAAGALLAAVASIEGGFDALQTYGRGRLVWGCMQFTGTGGLGALMLRLRDWAPEPFAKYFQAAGIDAAPGEGLAVHWGGRTWRGWQALTRLHDEPALWKPFLLAAHDPAIQAGQVRAAYEHYLLPARALTVIVAGQGGKTGGEGSGDGAVVGGGLGGVLAHQIGSGRGNTAATVVGAGAGAYAGHQVEKNQKSTTTYQVILKMDDGKSRTFNFSKETSYRAGDKIKVVEGKLVKQ